jgi:AraC-like DNA-binding protein
MDPLTDVLTVAAVRGSVAASVVAGEPWGLRLNAVPGAAFHAVTAGMAWLLTTGRAPLRLTPGDAVLLPTGAPHLLASDPDAATQPFDHEAAESALDTATPMRIGAGPATTRILCASYAQDPAATVATFALLPPVLHQPALTATAGLRATLELLAQEIAHPAPGARAVLDHVVNVLLVQLLRCWLNTDVSIAAGADPDRRSGLAPSWLRGLADPVSAKALSTMHGDPARAWTTDELARVADVSRATLNRRFTDQVGTSPAGYLTSWRLELAAHHLRTSDIPVGAVARRVGYTSEYAFNRAFRRRHGQPPGRYRTAYHSPTAAL